jgi:hypothetical protein
MAHRSAFLPSSGSAKAKMIYAHRHYTYLECVLVSAIISDVNRENIAMSCIAFKKKSKQNTILTPALNNKHINKIIIAISQKIKL